MLGISRAYHDAIHETYGGQRVLDSELEFLNTALPLLLNGDHTSNKLIARVFVKNQKKDRLGLEIIFQINTYYNRIFLMQHQLLR